MPPKKSKKKKKLSNWDIALANVGRVVRDAQVAKGAFRAGRIHENAASYESPGYTMDIQRLVVDRDEKKRGGLIPVGRPLNAPNPDTVYASLEHFKSPLAKIVAREEDDPDKPLIKYAFDTPSVLKAAKTLLVDDEMSLDVDGHYHDSEGVGTKARIWNVKIKRLAKR